MCIRTDVWSLGCLLYAWWYFYSPFESEFTDSDTIRVTECSYSRVLAKISRKHHMLSEDIHIYDIVEWILQKDFTVRPTTMDVIERVEYLIDELSKKKSEDFV